MAMHEGSPKQVLALISYPYGSRRINLRQEDAIATRAGGVVRRLQCKFSDADEAWLRGRGGAAEAEALKLSRSSRDAYRLEGFVLVQPGRVSCGTLSEWDREEDMLFEYLCRPRDAFSVQILSAKKTRNSIPWSPAVSLVDLSRHRAPLQTGITPVSANLSTVEVADGDSVMTISRMLADWGVPPTEQAQALDAMHAVLLCSPVMGLVLAGSWQRLVLTCSKAKTTFNLIFEFPIVKLTINSFQNFISNFPYFCFLIYNF